MGGITAIGRHAVRAEKLKITFFFIPLSYITLSLPSFLSSQNPTPIPLPQIHSFVSLQKGTDFPGIATKHDISSCNNTIHNPSYYGDVRQPSRRKCRQKCQKQPLLPLLGAAQEHQTTQS